MRLKLYINIWFGICFLLFGLSEANAESVSDSYGKRKDTADSIMDKVVFYAPFYERIVADYQAELYIKGRVNIKKQNAILRYLPTMFRLKKGVKEYMTETYSDLHFSAPDIYEQRVKASMGTTSGFWEADGRLLEYFHVNIYSSTLLYDKLLSPLSASAKKYYKYRLDSIMGDVHNREYKIRFIPKNKSFQLVGGYLIVSDNVWSVREIRFAGRSEVFRFNNRLKMGKVGELDEFLPVQSDVDGVFRFFGNVIEGSYVAVLDYKSIQQRDPGWNIKDAEKNKLDLSESYTMSIDTNICHGDTACFNALRPIPLASHEQELYRNYSVNEDTITYEKKSKVTWGQIEDALIDYNTLKLKQFGDVRLSPLINPFMMGYSAQNGFSYRLEFRYSRLFSGDRLLRITPRVGYNLKLNEFYWRVKSNFEYWPRSRATIGFEFGNGNRIYSSAMMDDLKAIPDSIFNFDRLNLDYYKDLYFTMRHSWEIINGLKLDVNLSVHRRTDTNRSKYLSILPDASPPTRSGTDVRALSPDFSMGVLSSLYRTYNSFAPGLRLTWTPGQYYYMDGNRKVNLHSKYPTISLDWERGLSGVLPNSGSYERLEFDFQHDISLGLMRNLYYRLGWGAFTKQQELYFIDFANFARSNLPTGWNDDFGGVFQLLDRRWYNSSRHYARGHATYESPFLLLRHLNEYTQYVLNERLYLGALFVPHLNPYVEFGYGIGTHIFDFGAFISFANWKYKEVGVKFTFELFNR